jgi:hypothetical protein
VSAETTRPIRNYFWSRDSKFILYAQDNGGDEMKATASRAPSTTSP